MYLRIALGGRVRVAKLVVVWLGGRVGDNRGFCQRPNEIKDRPWAKSNVYQSNAHGMANGLICFGQQATLAK